MQHFFQLLSQIFEFVMNLPQHLIEPLPFLPHFLKHALIDSLNLVPFLFIVFVVIEVIEQFFTKKKHLLIFFIKKIGPLFGSLFASIPQCGFSVIASTLYVRRILSRGTLLAVYLATSDEAIPVLLTFPNKAYLILPIILIKIIVAIFVGYLVDIVFSYKAKEPVVDVVPVINNPDGIEEEQGCCHHKLFDATKTKDFWIHPLKHTLNIFTFILVISIILGFVIHSVGTEENLAKYCLMNSPLQPLILSLLGLIPNCAISVMMTMLFVKHTISFGALVAGLCTSGGLGMLVLYRKNGDKKDTAIIILTLVVVSSIVGLFLQYNVFNINHLFGLLGINF